ncbi:prion-inhibition and propagation-domain-containing protein [Podospora aff. communis PSN243]|uniref:Prion-inhibition and propagation-domain-containing protein n=1 Tax=Podospora aff. communis PSN243 TaxID=3040156 RepID=A0AAV9GJZ7_9PEZI|nr:prion-inhibition and propagation-domain-containing protein [Podospora aff. communis PSN243]
MAETAGLAVGVIALAGLFNDCLDTISRISAIRSMGRDAQILNTKLDVEKTLFLQWAESVRLLHDDCDDRLLHVDPDGHLDRNSPNKAIADVLSCLHSLLQDSSGIQDRYGLQQQTSDLEPPASCALSGNRMTKFKSGFERLSAQLPQLARRGRLSIVAKVQWVAVDRERFGRLVDDLSHFVTKLNQLVPPVDPEVKSKAETKADREAKLLEALGKVKGFVEAPMAVQKPTQDPETSSHAVLATMAKDDIATIDNSEALMSLIDPDFGFADGSLENYLVRAARARYGALCRDILSTLWFRRIDDRRQCISPAHSQTLEWALKPPAPETKWADLADWLRCGSGFYWISGKAGCGKSTLMRHLSEHASVRELLCDWAANSRLITGSFYYYHLGTVEQKTHEGLTRTLLHHILEQNRSLIPEILPGMWKEAIRRGRGQIPIDLPTQAETRTAFEKLAQIRAAKICLFIDGLDEHMGSHQDSISFIQSMIRGGNIKVLLSSRPEPDFLAAFSNGPTLRMHDLTRRDIETYVADHVGSHPHMQSLMARKSVEDRARKIVVDIIEKAEGIFLWIVLACRSVQTGLVMGDRIAELEHRVEELPRELGNMFCHMLRKVEGRYRSQGVKYLRICHEAHRSITAIQAFNSMPSNLVDGLVYKLPTVPLSLLDEHHEDLMGFGAAEPLSAKDLEPICHTFAYRMNSRCGGLLEIRHKEHAKEKESSSLAPKKPAYLMFELAENTQKTYDPILDSEVVFMHRTVAEFLDDTSSWNLDGLDFTNNEFHPQVALSCLWMYAAQLSNVDGPYFGSSVVTSLFQASQAARDGYDSALIPVLPEFDKVFQPYRWSEGALVMAVQLGVVGFVRDYFDKHRDESVSKSRPRGFPLLYHALSYSLQVPSFADSPNPFGDVLSPEMVDFLFKEGCLAMQLFRPPNNKKLMSPWKIWVSRLSQDDAIHPETKMAITESFLTRSLDRDAVVSYTTDNSETLLPMLLFQGLLRTGLEKLEHMERLRFREKALGILRGSFGDDLVSRMERGNDVDGIK